MYNILFVCYGNICRSPMAEMIFKDLIYKNNKRYLFNCSSVATSMEEYGNGIYPKARDVLLKNGISVEKHLVSIVKKEDYNKYDCLNRIFNGYNDNKIYLLRYFTNNNGEIEDPWYTGNFDKVYSQIYEGCVSLFNYLVDKGVKDE